MQRTTIGSGEYRCIRVFHTEDEVKYAEKLLKAADFPCYVTEDGFGRLTLRDLGFRPRFRLYVRQNQIDEIGLYLMKKLGEKRVKK